MLSTSEKYGDGTPQVINNITQNCGCCCGCCKGGNTTPAPEPEPEAWTEFDGGWAGTTEAEYAENKDHWLDGGDAAGNQTGDLDGGEA